jgi:hypothetical protein
MAGEELLARDHIPDENQKSDCFSCGEKMTGLYCHACGQKNDDYRRSIWSLFSETFASVFSLENRICRTWLLPLENPDLTFIRRKRPRYFMTTLFMRLTFMP